MYVTDFREEALKHVIESLDSALFERVTGLTVEDFKLLNRLGLFNAQHMNAAIYQFRAFENASLHYADDPASRPELRPVGLSVPGPFRHTRPSWKSSPGNPKAKRDRRRSRRLPGVTPPG